MISLFSTAYSLKFISYFLLNIGFISYIKNPSSHLFVLLLSGCIFIRILNASVLYTLKWSLSVVTDSLRPYGLQPTRLLCPWDFPGKSAGVGCHFLLQEIFPTQGLNPGLPHCRQTLYHLSHQGSPIYLNYVFIYHLYCS